MIKRYTPVACRVAAAALLAYLSIVAIEHGGHERLVGGVEISGAILFAAPKIWRIGGALLLAVIAFAFVVHTIGGHPPLLLVFPALVIILLLTGTP